MGPLQISDTPFQSNVILNIDFWRCLWTRFGPTRVRAPQKVFFLISMELSAEKGIRRSGGQVPVNTFVSLAACTSLTWMFSLALDLNLRHVDCLSADFISPLLLFSEASLWHWQNYFRWWRVFPLTPPMSTCTVLLASLLTLCCCFMKLLSGKVLQHQERPNLENHEVNLSDALAIPMRYHFFCSRHISLWHIQIFWWQAR